MSIQLGQVAPDFEQDSTVGRIRFPDWLGASWGVLFRHPKDFPPVCTTELGEAARLKPEFDRRGVKIIGLSVDTLDNHGKWNQDIADVTGAEVNFPMISDAGRTVSDLYGMVHPQADPALTVRSVFVIDPAKKVRMMLAYPPSAGRSFPEILRVIDSLQLTDGQKVSTPVNWQPGERAIILPSVSDEAAKERFPQGWETKKPYLRYVDVSK